MPGLRVAIAGSIGSWRLACCRTLLLAFGLLPRSWNLRDRGAARRLRPFRLTDLLDLADVRRVVGRGLLPGITFAKSVSYR